ncbi:MAG: YitT family protein [Proteobacteria bacterium]|nr:YitT family protein [Pseudomonadota bacterium]
MLLLSKRKRVIFDYVMITLGSLIAAIGLGVFMVEAAVVPGGVTGISMTINFVWPTLSVGALIWILNFPLFLWGIRELGGSFAFRTLYGFSTNAFFIDLLRGDIPGFNWLQLQNTVAIQYMLQNDFFFFILLGSVFVGVGLGLVFKFKATTAGTEIVSAILKKRFGIKPGMSIMFVDFFVIAAATIVLYVQNATTVPALVLAAYALFSLYLSSIILDRIVYGFDYAKSMMIMSEKNGEIADFIIRHLDRGVTALYARGLFTNQDREVLMAVVSQSDARELSPKIRAIDPNAFVILSNVHEVLGEGFRTREEVDIKFLKSAEHEAEKPAAEAAKVDTPAEDAENLADAEAPNESSEEVMQ